MGGGGVGGVATSQDFISILTSQNNQCDNNEEILYSD